MKRASTPTRSRMIRREPIYKPRTTSKVKKLQHDVKELKLELQATAEDGQVKERDVQTINEQIMILRDGFRALSSAVNNEVSMLKSDVKRNTNKFDALQSQMDDRFDELTLKTKQQDDSIGRIKEYTQRQMTQTQADIAAIGDSIDLKLRAVTQDADRKVASFRGELQAIHNSLNDRFDHVSRAIGFAAKHEHDQAMSIAHTHVAPPVLPQTDSVHVPYGFRPPQMFGNG